MKLAIGNDHASVDLKNEIKEYLAEKGYELLDVGTNKKESFPYAVSAFKVGKAVLNGEADAGIMICGTGVGIGMAANKLQGIRCCICSEPYTARLSKQHNNSNCIAFGSRVVGPEMAKMIVDEWLNASYEGGRHQARIDMIQEIGETQQLRAALEYTD